MAEMFSYDHQMIDALEKRAREIEDHLLQDAGPAESMSTASWDAAIAELADAGKIEGIRTLAELQNSAADLVGVDRQIYPLLWPSARRRSLDEALVQARPASEKSPSAIELDSSPAP